MNKKSSNFIMFDVYLNHKTNIDKIDKYKNMLDYIGNESMSTIARDIRQCIINLKRNPYMEEYDKSEKTLEEDIFYIQYILNKYN